MNAIQLLNRILMLALVGIFVGSCAAPKEAIKYTNPIALQRADPWVTKADDGTYFLVATAPEYDRIEIRKSKTINGLTQSEPVVVWKKHETGPMSYHIWAPELHRVDGKWYIYFAAAEAENIWKIRIWVLSNESADPTTGTWVEEGQISTQRDEFALDATTFEVDGQRYLVWAEKTRPDINSGLVIAKMTSPTTIEGPEVVITEPQYEWEMHKYKVNEGAAVLIRNGKIFITFSASATDATYAMGLLWAEEGADLMNPASWNKLDKPVFFTNDAVKRFGPGHNSFTVAEDGKTDVLIYHARDYKEIKGESLYDPNRNTRARTFGWTKEGFPNFGQDLAD